MTAVGRGLPQIVDMRGRDRGQPRVLAAAVDVVLAPQDAAHRRSRQPLVGGIGGRQQGDVLGRVAAREAMPARHGRLDLPPLPVASDQTRDLRQTQAADLDQVAPHDPFVFLGQPQIALPAQHALDEAVDLGPARARKAEPVAGGHKPPHLLQRETLSILHGDLHSPAMSPAPTDASSGSSCIGNTPPFQDHLALDNSPGRNSFSEMLQ